MNKFIFPIIFCELLIVRREEYFENKVGGKLWWCHDNQVDTSLTLATVTGDISRHDIITTWLCVIINYCIIEVTSGDIEDIKTMPDIQNIALGNSPIQIPSGESK